MPTGSRFEGGRRQAWREDQAAKRGQQRGGTPGPDRPRDDRPRDDDQFARPRDDRSRDDQPRDDRFQDDRLNDDRPRDFGRGGRDEPGRFTGDRDRPGQAARSDRYADRDARGRDDRHAGQERDDRFASPGQAAGDVGQSAFDVASDPRRADAGDDRPAVWDRGPAPSRIRDDRPEPWRTDREPTSRRDDRPFAPRRDESSSGPRRDRDGGDQRHRDRDDRPRTSDDREYRPARSAESQDRPARYGDPRDRDREQPAGSVNRDGREDRFRERPDDRGSAPRRDDRWERDRPARPMTDDRGPGFRPAPDRDRDRPRDDVRWGDRPSPRRDVGARSVGPGGDRSDRSPSPRDARYFQDRAVTGGGDRAPGPGPARPDTGTPDRPRLARSARTTGSPKADADALLARLGVAGASFADQYGAVQIYARKAGKSLPNGLRSDLRRRGLLPRRGNGRPMQSASLADVRAHIDRVDQQLVEILVERGAYVAQAAAFKADDAAVADPARVETVIANARRHAEGWAADPSLVEDLYRVMIPVFIAHEHDVHEGTRSSPGMSEEMDSDQPVDGDPDELIPEAGSRGH